MSKNRLLSNLIIFAILISVFTDCKNSSTSGPEPSEGQQILIGQKIELSSTFSTIDLEIIDSLLIILTYGDSYFFHVYNKNTLKLIGKFGREGRGPFEYHLPHMMSQIVKKRDSSYLIILDDTRKRIDVANILGAVGKSGDYYRSINFGNKELTQAFGIHSAVMTADSFVVGNPGTLIIGADYGGKFFCYSIYTDKMTWEPYYPIPKIPPIDRAIEQLYASYLALRPNGNDIAAASAFFNRIDILDKKGKLKRSIVFNQEKDPDFSKADSWPPKGSHFYFTSISVSQDYIYALDIDIEVDNRETIDTVSLIKTTWEDKGIPPEILRLTPKVGKIKVDEASNKIFGIRSFDSFIYIYDMGKSQDK